MKFKDDVIFESLNPKQAAEFTKGDPARIKYMREVKANKKMQQQVIDYSPNKVTTTKSKPLVDVEKTLEKYEDDYVSKRGEQTIALANTAAKLKGNINKDDYILKEDGNGLMVNKNKTIAVRDSFVAKQFNRALGAETEATPQQVGKLAEKLERNRQMTGAKPTKLNDLKNRYKNKPIQKRSVPLQDFKIDPVLPLSFFKPTVPDPETIRMEQRFNQIVKESKQPKGLPGILGIKDYD